MASLDNSRPTLRRMASLPASRLQRRLRWAEFITLFVALPLGLALFMPARMMIPVLLGFSVAGLGLLALTGGFDWRFLRAGWGQLPWGQAGLMALAIMLAGTAILGMTRPDALLALPLQAPHWALIIVLAYPLLSALPQELIFRALFFHRYGMLMPSTRVAMAVNAGVFALAHLMYWNLVACVMTAIGGWLFARAYLTRGFPSAWFLHALAGNLLFLLGMGAYFYTGNAQRPF